MRNKTWLKVALIVLFGVLLALLVPIHRAGASLSTITGPINGPDGTPVNGTIVFALSNPCVDTVLNVAVASQPVMYQIINGQLPSSAQLERNDQCQPQGTYYRADVFDPNGSLVFEANYVIASSSFNIGQAVPVNVTTSALSYQNPAFVNVSNAWSAPQTFNGLQWTSGTANLGIFTHSNTANRTYNFPDVGGTVCLTSGTAGCTIGYKIENFNTTPVTVTNNATLQPLMTFTLGANEVTQVGEILRIHGVGSLTNNSGGSQVPTYQMSIAGGTLIGATTGLSISNGSTAIWTVDTNIIFASTGAGGVTVADATFSQSPSGVVANTTNKTMNGAFSFNTTIAQAITFQITLGAANASYTAIQNGAMTERLN